MIVGDKIGEIDIKMWGERKVNFVIRFNINILLICLKVDVYNGRVLLNLCVFIIVEVNFKLIIV